VEKKAIDFKISKPVETEFSSYESVKHSCNPCVPKLEFPINLKNVNMKGLKLNPKQKEIIQKQGFVLSDSTNPSLYDLYPKDSQIPFFITSDLCLHTFHRFIDSILIAIEKEYLFDKFQELLKQIELSQDVLYKNMSNERLKQAVRFNIAYIATISKLLNPMYTIPNEMIDIVCKELDNIQSLQFQRSAIFEYEIDFSQFKVRGHYTESKKLENYFQAMMYAGLLSFVSRDPVINNEKIGKKHIVRAVLLISSFNETIWNLWNEINRVVTFFFGCSDNINPKELKTLWEKEHQHLEKLIDDNIVKHFLEDFEKLHHPKIHSMIVFPKPSRKIRSFNLFGQKYVPDSFIFQNLVYDIIPSRFMVKGMDIFSVFGDNRATELQNGEEKKYKGYKEQIQKLQDYFGNLTGIDWTENLYFLWIYTLLSLLKPLPEGYPSFMRTSAWSDKSLMTAHGTWTELRYDSILYVKQAHALTYSNGTHNPPPPADGYVEPNPEFYSRLFSIIQYLNTGLNRLNIQKFKPIYSSTFDREIPSHLSFAISHFSEILKKLREISCMELEGKPLYKEEYDFIRSVPESFSDMLNTKTPLIVADVFTDPNSGGVLEEALGFPYIIHVIVQDHEGNMRLTRGAMFSQYEFTVQLPTRLNNEDWAKMLSINPPEFHSWIKYLISDEKHGMKIYQNPVQMQQRAGWDSHRY